MSGKRVGVLLGGPSSEREVSFNTGAAVCDALQRKGYEVVRIDVGRDLALQLERHGVELVYNALHGKWGEDGCVQGLLELMRIPYTGSGVTASAVAMDKVISKRLFQAADLPVPQWALIEPGSAEEVSLDDLPLELPLVVKPTTEGSSMGISIVREAGQLKAALEEALRFDRRVILERYIKGREINVGVLDGEALGTVEVRPKLEFYNYEAKYTQGMTDYLCPAPIEPERELEALDLARRAHTALGCAGGTRVDLILDGNNGWWLLEVNTLPGLTQTSLLPKIARAAGIEFDDLVERILLGAGLKVGS
ncbi:MAG: D-alanine--D-alanine ligase [Candidatus Alcyoniella australis]|nr:D-alanine--D-alanine ligase [Candidatus Alcyoniella australis]